MFQKLLVYLDKEGMGNEDGSDEKIASTIETPRRRTDETRL